MKTNILLPNNQISAYGFACGYVQNVDKQALHKELYKEHNVYHVRSTKHNKPELNSKFDGGKSHSYTIWESFYKLSEARKFYRSIR